MLQRGCYSGGATKKARMLRMLADGACEAYCGETSGDTLVTCAVGGITLVMRAHRYDPKKGELLQIPLPLPFGLEILSAPVYWWSDAKTEKSAKLTPTSFNESISLLFEEATPKIESEPMILGSDLSSELELASVEASDSEESDCSSEAEAEPYEEGDENLACSDEDGDSEDACDSS